MFMPVFAKKRIIDVEVNMQNQIDQLKTYYAAAGSIVFFGGAGVSTESGIPDFRSRGGLYKPDLNRNCYQYEHPPEVMLSRSFFKSHTSEFYRFYRDKMVHTAAKPNRAHAALAEMERVGKLKAVITQNVDGLHQAAGSKNVIELHGSMHRNFCMSCRAPHTLDAVLQADDIPLCKCGGIIKPDIVLYEEGLDDNVMRDATYHISNADMLIIGGTSLVVYPAAWLIEYFDGDKLVVINKGETHIDSRAGLVIQESIGEVLHAIV